MALLVGDTLRQDYPTDFDHHVNEAWDEGDVEDVLQGLYFLENFVKGASFQHDNDRFNEEDHSEEYDYELDCDYYAPYVTSLPPKPIDNHSYDTEEGLTPDFWSDSIIDEIGIPTYTQRILDRKRILQTIAQNNNVDERDLQWATFMIRSRRFTTWNMVPDPMYIEEGRGGPLFGVFNQKKIEQIQGYLVPLIDMANHNPNPNAEMKISVNKWTRKFDETSSFALHATRPIQKGEEITISYGDGTSTCLELLDKYGFFVEGDEDGADERGLVDLKVGWGTSVEEDEVELDRLVRSGGDDSSTVSSSSSKLKTIVSRLQDEYTFNFPQVLENNEEMKLIGSGIREKLGINVYAVGMYGSPSLLNAVSPSDLRYKACQFGSSSSDIGSGMTSFVLEMILQAEGKVIAEAIADSVGVRYDGSRLDVEELENLISDGISGKGGQAKKGTTLRFDCTKEGVCLSVDGLEHGAVKASGIGKAFVDVYLDNYAVSPSLIDSCIENSSIASNAVTESSNESDVEGSASRRTMLSLRIWLKRVMKWTKPEETSVTVVSDVVDAASAEASDEVPSSVDSTLKTSNQDADTTKEANETVAVAEVSTDEVANESISDDVSSDDMSMVESTSIQPTVDEPTQVEEEEAINQEVAPVAAVQPEPEVAGVWDKPNVDTKDIAARIRELEAEISEEIIRVKSQVGAPNASDLESLARESASQADAQTIPPVVDEKAAAVESKAKSIKEKATGVSFDPKLEEGLFLVGAGVRKKAIINVYAVAMYSSPTAIASLGSLKKGKDAQSTLRDSSRTFSSFTTKTSFVLEMTFKADGKTIAEAIADGVKPRHSGSPAAVAELENLIVEGVKSKGGQATKGTIFRFDCDAEGVSVSVDGNQQGKVASEGMGSALVDVFMDDKAVSPQLVDNCMETWCGSGL